MALAKDLEIYKAADQLLALSLRLQVQVPRAYRQAVGQRISNECADILLTVARANAARGESREAHIATLLERLEAATALLRASHGLRLISTKVWAESIELTDSVGKQANGWLKSARNFSAAPAA
jgi:hypothetical protein